MSDTRAAIRELRSLSEKRSLSALTEAESARWLTLRRQLGLPAEPVTSSEVGSAWKAAAAEPAAPFARPSALEAMGVGNAATSPDADGAGAAGPAWAAEEANDAQQSVSMDAPSAQDENTPGLWGGPALDSPVAPAKAANWGGPALDAPAWSDVAAERQTDPGLDEPPPAPFDEVPAAPQPPEEHDFGGSPDERVPLAAAADFVSYSREGDEAIEVPEESGTTNDLEPQSLAQLAGAPSRTPSAELLAEDDSGREIAAVPEPDAQPHETLAGYEGAPASAPYQPGYNTPEAIGTFGDGPLPEQAEAQTFGTDAGVRLESPLRYETPLTEGDPDLGVLVEPPLQLEPAAPDVFDPNEGVLPEPPLQLESATPEALDPNEGVLPEPALQLESAAPEALDPNEGVLPEPPLQLESAAPEALDANQGVLPEPPLQLEPAASEAFDPNEGAFLEPAAPDALDANEGVLPQPPLYDESPLVEGTALPAEFALAAPFDENPELPAPDGSGADVASESLAALPPAVSTWAPGSAEPPVLSGNDFARSGDTLGGRGLDPWPEALNAETLTDDVVETVGDEDVLEDVATPTPLPPFPTVSPPGSGGIRGFQFPRPPPGPAPVASTPSAWHRTQPSVPPAAIPIPRAADAPSRPPPTPQTPPPPMAVARPAPAPPPKSIPPAAVAPTTPPPQPARPFPPAPVPVTPLPMARPSSPLAPPGPRPAEVAPPSHSAPAPLRASAAQPRTPAPVQSPATASEDEALQPLLELVDEVEPPRPAARTTKQPTPSPAVGTAAVFGPPMVLNPSFVEGDHRVVIHTLEGQVHRGTVHNLDLQDDALAVQQPDGRSVQIPTRRLKAVFFVLSPGEKQLPTRGERVQVTFRDGRQVVGYSDDHATGEPGFFVVPSDARTNTARVYVFRGGVQSITTG